MRKAIAWVVAAAAVAFAGCGDKSSSGGGGVVGTWALDKSKIIEMGIQKAKENMTADARKAMTDDMIKQMTENMFKDAKWEMTFKDDKTVMSQMSGMPGNEAETGEGIWSQTGDKVTVTRKTKNGKPVTGEDVKPIDFTIHGGTMTFRPGPDAPEMALKRK